METMEMFLDWAQGWHDLCLVMCCELGRHLNLSFRPEASHSPISNGRASFF